VHFVLALVFLSVAPLVAASDAIPLIQAHAHNDYEHARPLLDALDRGFCSIEADVYLVEGQLLVAHNLKDVKPGRTLTALYLDPLRARVRQNGGRAHRNGPPVTLLIDVKSEAVATYMAVNAVLEKYAAMLTTFSTTGAQPGAVTVIISGNRAPKEMLAQSVRYAAMDGRKDDLDANTPRALVPLVSENWTKVSNWRWNGEMPPGEQNALKQWVERAHAQGRRVRFWNTPDRPEAWRLLLDAGVDVIGTDDLDGLQRFLRAASR
jgi:hypothetical protein